MAKKSIAKKKIESKKRGLKGVVVSAKMVKTVKVAVETMVAHPKYKKSMKRIKTYLVHTEKDLKEGDKVTIVQSRPFSKQVAWIIKDAEV